MISVTNHISQKFNQDLARLYKRLDELSTLTVSVMHDIQLFIDALSDTAQDLSGALKQIEQKVNNILLAEVAIDEECERILALYQPVASDLRTVISIIRILGEIQAIANALQQMLKLFSRFNAHDASQKKSVPLIGADKLSYLAVQTGLLTKMAMQLIVGNDTTQNTPILKQYKLTKRSYKRLVKLLDKTHTDKAKAPLYSFRFAQEFMRILTHVKLIIGHFIYLNEGKDVRHLSFSQMREIMELSLDHD